MWTDRLCERASQAYVEAVEVPSTTQWHAYCSLNAHLPRGVNVLALLRGRLLRTLKSTLRPLIPILLAASVFGGCKKEVQFTRVPFAGVLEADAKASETRVFLSIPANLAPVLEAVEVAVGNDVAKSREYIDEIACDKRKGNAIECNGAVVSTTLTRTGPAEATVDGHRLLLTFPLRYEINARGQGWAAYLQDRKVGSVKVGVAFDVSLSSGYRLDVRMGNELLWSEKAVPVLKGRLVFARMADAKIKAQLKAANEPLRLAIGAQPMREATEKAWKALHMPVALTQGSSLWLRGAPERVVGAGFALEDSTFVYRIGLDTRIIIHSGERPAPLFGNPLPEPSRVTANAAVPNAGKTVLRLPFEINSANMLAAVVAVFPKTDIIETRADAKSPPLKVRPTAVQLFASRDRLALELQLDVIEPARLFGMTGRAFLTGKPVLDPGTGILDIRDIGFPAIPPKDAKSPPGLLRIGEEPFAGRFASAARLNLSGVLGDLLPKLNAQIQQTLADKVAISGQFDVATIRSVEPVSGGFRLNLELVGVLTLKMTPLRSSSGAFQQTGDTSMTPPRLAP